MDEERSDLHLSLVTAKDAAPERWMLFLHGIFGSGGNFRSVAKALCDARPSWGVALVDLRGHGLSLHAPPPNTIVAAAKDVLAIETKVPGAVRAIAGHSFGGKVALSYLDLKAEEPLEHAFILDSTPSAKQTTPSAEDSIRILNLLEAMPRIFPTRSDFVERVVAEGHTGRIADWLAMNVRREGEAFQLRNDLSVIRALLTDYFMTDAWGTIEARRGAKQIHVVVGGRSTLVSSADRARLGALARSVRGVHLHVLEDAGHWLHADDPEGVVALLSASLDEPQSAPNSAPKSAMDAFEGPE